MVGGGLELMRGLCPPQAGAAGADAAREWLTIGRSGHPRRGALRPALNHLTILLSVICVSGLAAGQLLFKQAAAALPAEPVLADWLTNPWLYAALGLYGAMTILWIWILRHAPLSIAYPFMALAFIIVPLLARLVFGEPLSWQTLAGGALRLSSL